MIEFESPWALAARMADRSETMFAAVLSNSVFTWNVAGVTRASSPSSPGR
jgi:hypothetical protein